MAGAVSGLLAASCTSLLFYAAELEKTAFTVDLTVLALWASLGAEKHRTPWRWALAGASWGALALLRGNFLLLLPCALLWAFVVSGRATGLHSPRPAPRCC